MYNKLVTKVDVIDTKKPSTSGLFTEKQYNSDKQGLGKKIEDDDKRCLTLVGWSKQLITTQKYE